MARPSDFVKQLTSPTIYHPGGTTESRKDPAVWTVAHRGYSGNGRLDGCVFRTKDAALRAGAVLAMESGLDEDPKSVGLFEAGRFAEILERYEELDPDDHLLRVQAAFLQMDGRM